jgi:hypothetical protein
MASAVNAASAIVGAQQSFAKEHDLGALFETLTVALIVKKPARAALLAYLAEELARVTAARKRGERYVPEGGKGVDTEEGAARYLQDEGVHALLEDLLTRVLVAKPAEPADFLQAECAARIAAAAAEAEAGGAGAGAGASAGATSLFTDDDLRGIHSLFDPTHTNAITAEQARAALRTIGVAPAAMADDPALAEGARLDVAAFVKVARHALSIFPVAAASQ